MDPASNKSIGQIFYETRVLMGRDFSQRRFAEEVLRRSVDPAMLGFIEKGQRFPTEAQVRQLAAVRRQDAHELLALLWRERIVYAFGRELRHVLQAPRAVDGMASAELSVLVSKAIAGLPDDGSWRPIDEWRKGLRAPRRSRRRTAPVATAAAATVEQALKEQRIIQVRGNRVRRIGKNYTARTPEARRSLAIDFCNVFTKALLEQLALEQVATSYLQAHFLHISPSRIPEFHKRLDAALVSLREEFAEDESRETILKNILVAATPY